MSLEGRSRKVSKAMKKWQNTNKRFWEAQADTAGKIAELLAQVPEDVAVTISFHEGEESPVREVIYDSKQRVVSL
jgi:hypothetical protein